MTASEVLSALSTHLGADPDGRLAYRLLSMVACDHPGALLDAIAASERLYSTSTA